MSGVREDEDDLMRYDYRDGRWKKIAPSPLGKCPDCRHINGFPHAADCKSGDPYRLDANGDIA